MVVSVPATQPKQTVTITLNYKLKVKSNSGLNSLSQVGSQFLPLAHWYPTPTSWYYSKGADFAPYTLKINSPSGHAVLSSGIKNNNSFEQKHNGQPHFITGRWNVSSPTSDNIEIYSPDGVENPERVNQVRDLAVAARNDLESFLGVKISVPIRIIAVNRGAGFSDSGTIFVDDSVFVRQKIDA